MRTDIKERLDREIWSCLCDCFGLNIPFTLEEAVDKVREHVLEIGRLPYDYALGRVLGALKRIEPTTDDLAPLPTPGEYTWMLPSRTSEV